MKAPNPLLPRRVASQPAKSNICLKILKLAAIRPVPIPRLFGVLCAVVFWSNPVQAAPGSTDQSGVQLTIELRDGSRIVGKSLEDTLSFHSAMLNDMKLPWAGIRSIEYAGTNAGGARLTAANGDSFTIQLATETLRVETGFGQADLPVKQIRSVKVTPPVDPNAVAGTKTAQLAIELRDGSHVVGKSLADTLIFHSPAMGDLKLTWAGIRSIEYTGINTEMARLTAANGDVYEAQFAVASLGVETSFGRTELPVQLIRSIKVSAAGQSGQLSSGLVARWLGDGDAKDSAGHFDGQASGGLRYVPGPAGQAFQFNGGDAQVDFGNSAGNFGKGDFTIVFWIRTTSRNPYEAFLSKRPTCDAAFSHWNIFVGSRTGDPTPGFVHCGIAEGGYKDPSGNALFSSRPINDGQWHHVAWVRQSTSSGSCTGLIYMDGALDNSMTYLQAFDIANQAPLLLGRNVCEGHDACRPYSGAAADLQLFSQALLADEIIAIYQAGKSGK